MTLGDAKLPPNYAVDLGPLSRWRNELALLIRRRIFEVFMREIGPAPDDKVADFGVSGRHDHRVHSFFEALYPHTRNLSAIGRAAEGAGWMEREFPGLTFIEADLRSIPVPDGHFDAGICHAVMEHAGSRANQQALVREVCRVCRAVLFTTPDKRFPLEMHTCLPLVHWLPDRAFRRALTCLGLSDFAHTENLNLLDAQEFVSLFPPDRDNRIVPDGLWGGSFLAVNLICVSASKVEHPTLLSQAAYAVGRYSQSRLS